MPTFLLIKGQWNNIIRRFEGADKNKVNEIFNEAIKNK
jgi:hypothetical protein